MGVAAEPRPLGQALPGGKKGATVRVHPICTGELHSPPALIDKPSGRLASVRIARSALGPRGGWDWLPIITFLIEHPTAGAVLVDTGLHPSVAQGVAGNFGFAGRFYEARMKHDQALRFQLPRRGVEPEDVKVVVMTHLHTDHASAVSEFAGATFVVDAREWEAATTGRGWLRGYHPRQFDHAFDWRTVDFYGPLAESFSGFAATVDLFGDGSVRLAATPGHTLGHLSVICRIADGEVLITGDAVYTQRMLRGETLPLLWADEHLWRRSLRELQRYVEQTPSTVVVPGHDPATWPDVPAVLE
jgi:glyoxylase-like metal-dependent hydrolase (beta-lactamase superfamily II)